MHHFKLLGHYNTGPTPSSIEIHDEWNAPLPIHQILHLLSRHLLLLSIRTPTPNETQRITVRKEVRVATVKRKEMRVERYHEIIFSDVLSRGGFGNQRSNAAAALPAKRNPRGERFGGGEAEEWASRC